MPTCFGPLDTYSASREESGQACALFQSSLSSNARAHRQEGGNMSCRDHARKCEECTGEHVWTAKDRPWQ
ncbi:hypothetical protein HYQ46_010481 [Verticillium longisporum]|nr:hypothetical protein HYQ46_010481 [Verticillium longisporum]